MAQALKDRLPPESPESLDTPSIGSYLARQRRLRGISIDELAELTRIPLRSLERLESGSFDDHVDGFVRGFVRTVAQALGLDPDDTLARMLREPDLTGQQSSVGVQLSVRRVAALALVGAILVALVGLVRFSSWPTSSAEPAATEIVHRFDPIRALAEAERDALELVPVGAPPLRSFVSAESRSQ